jgi:NifB/MoaA-like Fe-S oxidoreductase
MTPSEARALVGTAEGWQRRWRAELGSRFVFLADEIYLLAGLPLPTAASYEGFPIAEDGIGLVRRFEDGFARAVARGKKVVAPSALTVVTGEMFAPRLGALLGGAGIDPAAVHVAAIPNDFFGSAIGVAGLLTGRDIQRRLATRPDLGRAVLVPAVALRDADGVFLDDLTPADLARDLGVPVRVVAPTPGALLKAIRNA